MIMGEFLGTIIAWQKREKSSWREMVFTCYVKQEKGAEEVMDAVQSLVKKHYPNAEVEMSIERKSKVESINLAGGSSTVDRIKRKLLG